MSIRFARTPQGAALPLPEGPPTPCAALGAWRGLDFELPCGDPRLLRLSPGEDLPPALHNLLGLAQAWEQYPEWLDFLDPQAPNHHHKLLERSLYLHHFAPYLPRSGKALDVGGGCGRFATWLLAQGMEVQVVDPDLRSLRRCLWHAAGGPGALDLHWTTAEALPELPPQDVVFAMELLCYVQDPESVLRALLSRLRPGGLLFGSVEARWGWAACGDAAPGSLESALGDGVVFVPGDRWVRCYDEPTLRALLGSGELLLLEPTHYACSGPLEPSSSASTLEELLALEARLRAHPVYAPLHRAWTFVLRRF